MQRGLVSIGRWHIARSILSSIRFHCSYRARTQSDYSMSTRRDRIRRIRSYCNPFSWAQAHNTTYFSNDETITSTSQLWKFRSGKATGCKGMKKLNRRWKYPQGGWYQILLFFQTEAGGMHVEAREGVAAGRRDSPTLAPNALSRVLHGFLEWAEA